MTEDATSPVLQAKQETPADPRAGLTHVQRTDPVRLYREYEQYFQDERKDYDEKSEGWQRVKKTWFNMCFGIDGTESHYFQVMTQIGVVSGFAYGAIYKSAQQVRQYQQQHDEFIHAGLLKEKDQLFKTTAFRLLKRGIRSGLIATLTPMAIMCGGLSSVAYHNSVSLLDFGAMFAITNVLFNIKRERSLIIRHGAIAFGAGIAFACALRGILWLTDSSASEWRYWAVTRRDRVGEVMSRKSWEAYRDKPEFTQLYEREQDLIRSWKRHAEQLAILKEKRESGEIPLSPERAPQMKLVIDR